MQGTVKFGAIVGVGVLAVATWALAKRDKGAEPLAVCVGAFTAGELRDARTACDRAVSADPDGASGRKAKEQLALIEAKESALQKKGEAEEEARREARQAQEAQEARCSKWTTICTLGRFPDGSERTTGAQRFSTKAACAAAGTSLGVRCDPCRCID